MKILVSGSRDYDDINKIRNAFKNLPNPSDITVIHGNCRGADLLSDQVAREMGFSIKPYPANWDLHGKSAGPIRNQQMLDENPDIGLALIFHPNLNESRGTKDMLSRIRKANISFNHYA